ncbi:MAG: LysR substrate-binding domain-containing protein, partial [Kiloniellales bacterium]|nr:LysR substrate-binding domain-containing protein [Kiloniellales bacterium]
LLVIPLRTDDVVFAASRDLVFDHDGELTLDDIDGLPMVGFPRDVAPFYFDRLQAGLAKIGFKAHYAQLAPSETAMLSLVSAGVGCAIVNSSNTNRPPRNVQFRKIQGLSVPIEFVFIHRDPAGTLLSLFIESLAA